MTTDQVIQALVTVTLIEMMATVGLGVRLEDLGAVARDWRLVGRALLANYVCVPAATLALLLVFKPHAMAAAGFLILAVCPGAPFGPPLTALARGEVPASVGLMVILAGSSALVAPLLLSVLLPLTGGDEALQIDVGKLLTTLFVTQLVPLAVGMEVRRWRPTLADRIQAPAGVLSKVLGLVVMVAILATQGHLLGEVRLRGYGGMVLLVALTLGAGWILGGAQERCRRAMTLTAALRNVGLALVIAAGSFPGTPAVTAILAYGLLEISGSLLLAMWWSRRTGASLQSHG